MRALRTSLSRSSDGARRRASYAWLRSDAFERTLRRRRVMARLGKYLAGVIVVGGFWGISACSSDDMEPQSNLVTSQGDEELRRRVPCASSDACRPNEFCTTETGACNRPPGCGRGDICPAVCYGVCRPRRVECRRDADCRTFSDYCTGCDCRALANREADPVCPGPGVQCFVEPCFNQRAVCVAGQCELAVR